MSAEREKFLNRIRDRLRDAHLPAASPEHPGLFQGYAYPAGASAAGLVESFKRELEALSGHVHTPGDPAEIMPLILKILDSHNARRIMAWDEAQLGLPGFASAMAEAGVSIEDSFIPAGGADRQARLAQLDGVPLGLTGADGGLADTGALALISGPGRGRLASLLPPVHLALLSTRQLYPSLPAFLAANPTAAAAGSNLVLITGPSRSADIELTLSIGVHGPGEIHVVIIP